MYRIYPTLLDSFFRYKGSTDFKEAAEAKQELLDKINRVPQVETPQQAKGKAFKRLVDFLTTRAEIGDKTICSQEMDGIYFERNVLEYFVKKLAFSIKEYYTSAQIVVDNEIVELYGYVDNIKEDVIIDVKFVNNYEVNKYFSSCQRLVYPYCLEQNGAHISQFEFLASNGTEVFSEVYNWKPELDIPMLKSKIAEFIDFVKNHRHLITDTKLVTQD